MKEKFAAVAALLAFACTGSVVRPPRQRMSPRQIFESSKPAIVRIEVTGAESGIGTGFVLRSDGLIATNFHVIDGAKHAKVVMADGREFVVDRVLAVDQDHDLAIIGVSATDLPILPLGDSDAVSTGDPVYTIGNPQQFDYTLSDGLISSVRHIDPSFTILQISAPISQGSSGGPLFNSYGEVIGVATALWRDGQNLNFGMPSNYLRPMLIAEGGMSFRVFATRERIGRGSLERVPLPSRPSSEQKGDSKRINRKVPRYQISYLDGCLDSDLERLASELLAAIEKGAPLYNDGDHEGCFQVYQEVATRLERELPTACRGGRDGLGAGLLRAETLESYTEKAWALRDAFDGLLDVLVRKLRSR